MYIIGIEYPTNRLTRIDEQQIISFQNVGFCSGSFNNYCFFLVHIYLKFQFEYCGNAVAYLNNTRTTQLMYEYNQEFIDVLVRIPYTWCTV